MTRLEVRCFSLSIDGYGAGPDQTFKQPLGKDGERVHEWMFATRTWARMQGRDGGETGIDDDHAARGFEGIGAWILGRNMFGPPRGFTDALSWKGWWGDEPPYHCPVFVLTHEKRPPLEMAGGTTFHFVNGGIEDALAQAREAASGGDIRLGGGVATIREYLRARLVDRLHLAIAPVLLGSGEALFAGIDLPALGYRCTEQAATAKATHVVLTRHG
jgi:dihydrofolate reductase